jgi:rubrerythrin
MTDHLTKPIKESGEKSAFVCVSCGHDNIPDSGKKTGKPMSQGKDRFSEAVKESGEKSAFVCVSCGHTN